MSGSVFTADEVGDVICIEDCNGLKSVTNDIENVLKELQRSGICMDRPVIYRDSEGVWTEVYHQHGEFVGFGDKAFDNRAEALEMV